MPPKRKNAAGKAEPAAGKAEPAAAKGAPAAAAKAKAEEPKVEEAKKRKAEEEEPEEQPPAKGAKVDEVDDTEKEVDAKADKRATLKERVVFHTSDTTLNAVPTFDDTVLATLTEGGMQYLIAGARGSVGVKAGRYMFEIRVIEALQTAEHAWGRSTPKPRQLVRVGFSTAATSLVLGQAEEHVFFDAEGHFISGHFKDKETREKLKLSPAKRFGKGDVVGVLLNLDPSSPNAYTMSLFKEGERASKPQPIPEHLRGKPLFPHVCYRNVTIQVNFGPSAMKELPFKCRLLGAAATADAVVSQAPVSKDGKCEVLLPVGYPDEGTFDWLEGFLQKHPQYFELSDRKILEWVRESGVWRQKGWRGCNDMPDMSFDIQEIDNMSIKKVLSAITTVVPRNYIVMEIKNNLLEEERKKTLARFSSASFKKVACVVMGEPDKEYKEQQLEKLLKEKQYRSDRDFEAKKQERVRKKAMDRRQKELEEARKKAGGPGRVVAPPPKATGVKPPRGAVLPEGAAKEEPEEPKEGEKADKEEKAEKEEAAKHEMEVDAEAKAEEKEKKEEGDAAAKEEGDAPAKEEGDEAVKDEEMKEEAKEDAEGAQEMEVDAGDEEPPKVELTEEEKKLWFRPRRDNDLTEHILNNCFAKFSIPEKSEGFDSISFAWQSENQAKEYLRDKIVAKKKVSRVENLKPSEWFTEKWTAWKKAFAGWQKKQLEFKSSPAQKAKAAKRAEKAKRKDTDEEPKDPEPEEEEKTAGDIFSVEDVSDVGEGAPLFKDFLLEDWVLLQLSYELYLLVHAFKRDVDDEDRPGVTEQHLIFYYGKYFGKSLTFKLLGIENSADLVKLVKGVVAWTDDHVLTCTLKHSPDDDISYFVKHTEECRRERQRRLDAGDETARLSITQAALNPPPAPAQSKGYGKGWVQAPKAAGWTDGKSSGGKSGGSRGGGRDSGRDGGGKGGGGKSWGKRRW